MSENKVLYVNDKEVVEIVNTNKLPVAVYFTAPWCSACKSFIPVLEEIAVELASKVHIVKMDIDDYPNFSVSKNIRSLPTIMVFKKGIISDTKIGASAKSDMIKFIKNAC